MLAAVAEDVGRKAEKGRMTMEMDLSIFGLVPFSCN